MNIIKIVMLISLLLVNLNAMSKKVLENDNKQVYEILHSDKVTHCMKPGLSVNLEYTSEHVNVGASANVAIVISTALQEGTLAVKVKSLEGLIFEERNLEFQLSSKEENRFPINFEVSSAMEGEYFLTLELFVKEKGRRIFEVPVKFGTILQKPLASSIETTEDGRVITVSKAIEEIK